MRTFVLVALVVSLLVFGASAQISPEWVIYVDGELGFPTNPEVFTDGWNTLGFGGGAGIGAVLTPLVTVTGKINYTYIGLDEDAFTAVSPPSPPPPLPPGRRCPPRASSMAARSRSSISTRE